LLNTFLLTAKLAAAQLTGLGVVVAFVFPVNLVVVTLTGVVDPPFEVVTEPPPEVVTAGTVVVGWALEEVGVVVGALVVVGVVVGALVVVGVVVGWTFVVATVVVIGSVEVPDMSLMHILSR